MLRRVFRLLSTAGMLAVAAGVALMVIAPFHIYDRFTDELPIAELYFEPVAPQTFRATLSHGDLCIAEEYLLYGDEWRLDAAFLKWRPIATLLGADPLYRIDRLSGRYRDVEHESTRPRLAHEIAPEVVLDPFRLRGATWLVDSVFGASVYHAMDPDARHIVYRSPTGLFVRTQPLASFTTANGETKIVIDRACAARDDGHIARAARALNDLF